MKLFLPVIAVCVTAAFGVQPQEIGDIYIGGFNPEPSYDLLYAQTYDRDLLTNGWSWGQICDDFELEADAGIVRIIIWGVPIDEDMNPIPPLDYCDIAFIQDTGDDDPNTAIPVWSGTASCTYVDINDQFGGGIIPIYELTCDFPSTANLTAGVRYWLVVTQHYEDYKFYSCVFPLSCFTQLWLNNGTEVPVWETGCELFGYEADMFFELYGTPESALENSTWGNIKSVF